MNAPTQLIAFSGIELGAPLLLSACRSFMMIVMPVCFDSANLVTKRSGRLGRLQIILGNRQQH